MPKNFFLKKLFKVIAILAVFIILVVWNPKNPLRPFREIFARTNYGFQKFFSGAGNNLGGVIDFLGSISELKNENEKLMQENNFLASETVRLQETEKENAVLREQMNLAPKNKFNLENAFVIGQDPQRLGSWIMIDKGSSAGVAVGMPVVAADGILIGKIEEVSGVTAKVNLLTNSTSIVNAIDLNTEAKGVIEGEYGLGILLDLVSQSDVLNKGDDVITSGLGGDLPRGLLIGKIQEIRFTSDKLFQQAVITPRIKYADLRVISVIKK